MGSAMRLSSHSLQFQLVHRQPLIEFGQPMGIDKSFQDTPYFKHMLLAVQGAQKT
jgi:hypothetical protein